MRVPSFIDDLPAPLLATGPGGLAWWQWAAAAICLVVAIVVARVAARLTYWALMRAASKTSVTWDDLVLARTRGPLRLLWAVALAYLLLPLVYLAPERDHRVEGALLIAAGFALVWGAVRVVDVSVAIMAEAEWARARPASRSLLLLGSRVMKVLIGAIALVAFLGALGMPIASLIAGLGIGGIALAFGAQKTVENLFGTFSIGIDQPLREGDFVKIGDTLGNVEGIGLRSTRIRTLDRTVVTLPNGKLSEEKIETFGVRDRIRLTCMIGVEYGTTEAQMRDVLAGLERVLRDHPKIWPDAVVVKFTAFGASSLDIEVMAWFQTRDFDEFRAIRQEVLLGFMGVIERAGTSFAFPTRTVRMINETPGPTAAT